MTPESAAAETDTSSWVDQIQRAAAAEPARVVDSQGNVYVRKPSRRLARWRIAGIVADLLLTAVLLADLAVHAAHWQLRRPAPAAPACGAGVGR